MGLSVKIYQNVKVTDSNSDYDFTAYVIDKEWEWKIKNLDYGMNYTGDIVYYGISYPYSSHNRFREKLLTIIDREDLLTDEGRVNWDELPRNIPFGELIDFADNEGCLDWEVSEKLFKDFKQWNLEAKEHLSPMDYERYCQWLTTFEYGKEQGVVVFI
jgi:hypothetical protein